MKKKKKKKTEKEQTLKRLGLENTQDLEELMWIRLRAVLVEVDDACQQRLPPIFFHAFVSLSITIARFTAAPKYVL